MDIVEITKVVATIGEAYKSGTRVTFCQTCLGANVPEQKSYPEGGWRCGSWCDGAIPPLGICTNFKLDEEKLKSLAAQVRPDGKAPAVYSYR